MTRTNHIYNFEKFQVWNDARELVKEIYTLTKEFPTLEKYGLISQMKRASISVVSNIAEGTGKTSLKYKAHFYQIAYSSLIELLNQLIIAGDLLFIDNNSVESARQKINTIASKPAALRNATLNLKR